MNNRAIEVAKIGANNTKQTILATAGGCNQGIMPTPGSKKQ